MQDVAKCSSILKNLINLRPRMINDLDNPSFPLADTKLFKKALL